MTYSQEKIDAYKKLDEAVDALRKVYKCEDDNDILTGYVLVTSSIRFCDSDPDNPDVDDLDTSGFIGMYARRGQDPTLTCGIIHNSVRHYNEVQDRYHGD